MTPIARRSLLGAVAALAAVGALSLTACGKGGGGAAGGATDISADMTQGKANAPVTVMEYASVTCPHCARWNEEVFPAFKAKYIDTGRVHYVFREAMIHGAPDAAGFLLARCAGKDKYFTVVDAIMRSQGEMGMESGFSNLREVYVNIAKSAGMSEAQFDTCVQNEANLKALNARYEKQMAEFDVQSTPTFVINGKKMPADHPPSLEELDAAIAAAK